MFGSVMIMVHDFSVVLAMRAADDASSDHHGSNFNWRTLPLRIFKSVIIWRVS
ncbi:MAG: hypothetical protein WBE48_04420 [Xanthobacteraceae bacterium]